MGGRHPPVVMVPEVPMIWETLPLPCSDGIRGANSAKVLPQRTMTIKGENVHCRRHRP